MITIFQNIKSIDAPYHRPIQFVLERIKKGNSKELLNKIRGENDKEERNKLKKELPSILFSGKFPHRKTGALPIEHSGLIVLDIDNVEDIQIKKSLICQSNYVYSCFVSPSGNGLKVLVKIPKDISRHLGYFLALENYFLESFEIEIDPSGKNINRVCYESFDSDIYVNNSSETFTYHIEPLKKEYNNNEEVSVPICDLSEIEKRVIAWWKKNYNYIEGGKHHSVINLAGAFNRFGIPESNAMAYCQSIASNPTSLKANEKRVRDMYERYKHEHATQFFEDIQKTKDISRDLQDKEMDVAIQILQEYQEFEEKTPIELEGIAKNLQDQSNIRKPISSNRVFWYYDDGKLKIDLHELFKFINDCGYWIYYPVKTPDNYQFVKIENNIIKNVDTREIKTEVLGFVLKNEQNVVYNLLNDRVKYWTEKFLNVLPTIDPPILRDSREISYIPTKSGVYKISKHEIIKIDYVDLKEGYVWESQITEFDFTYSDSNGDFKQFVTNLSGSNDDFKSLQTIIGYLLHNYKDPANSKAIFIFDKNISQIDGEPEGGSGKSLLVEGIKKLRDVACITGDRIDFKKQFVLQEISESTQIAWIDETDKNLNIKNFFSRITNGLPVEKKNKNSIYISNDKSPKFVFTTNFKPKGSSGSHKRRRIDFMVSDYYNVNHTPVQDFGKNFFQDWDSNEYNKFFSFYIECVKMYLKEGIVKQENRHNDYIELAVEFDRDFADYIYHDKKLAQWISAEGFNAHLAYNEFVHHYDTDILIKEFLKSVRKVLNLKRIKHEESGKSEKRFFKILNIS